MLEREDNTEGYTKVFNQDEVCKFQFTTTK